MLRTKWTQGQNLMIVQSRRRINYTRPWLYPKQEQAIFADARYSVIEASTKSGKTAGCLVWLFEQALEGRDGDNYWWVAPVIGQAKIAFRRMKKSIPKNVFRSNETELTITLINGAVIWFKGSEKPDHLYGEDVYACVIDEASRVREDAWFAIRSTLSATEGPVRIIGNVKGRKNWAYKFARRAERETAQYGRFAKMFYAKIIAKDAVDAGILSAEEVESAQQDLPEHIFRELYLAEPSDDGGNPFGLTNIENCIISGLSPLPVVALGWDLGKSQDYTAGVGLDVDGNVAYFEQFQKPWRETKSEILSVSEGVPTLIDSTGVGDPILEDLQHQNWRIEGFKFTGPSKQQLMEGLSVGIKEQKLGFPDGPIADELREFEFVHTRTGVRYSAPEGMHDDCVMGIALAYRIWQEQVRIPVIRARRSRRTE